MIGYNTGMQIRQRIKTERVKKDRKETWSVLGGFLCALLLSRVQLHAFHLPLSLGVLLGGALAGTELYGMLGGVVLGALIVSPPSWQTVCAAILFGAVEWILTRRQKPCRSQMRVVLFLAAGLAALPLCALRGAIELLYGAASLLISCAFGLCVHRIIRSSEVIASGRCLTDGEQIMLTAGIGAILTAMSEWQLFGWSASVSLMLTLTALFITVRGVVGAAAGTFWASLIVLYTGCDPSLIGCVALGALLGAVVRINRIPVAVGTFLIASLLFRSILSGSALSLNAQNLLCGMLLYLLTPRAWIQWIAERFDPSAKERQTVRVMIGQIEQNASEELMRIGKLLSGFSGMFHTALQEDDAVKRWTMQGALAVCRSCAKSKTCWKDAECMQDAVLAIAQQADRNQPVTPQDPVDPACRRFRELVGSVLVSYQQAQSKRVMDARVREQTMLIDRQFTGAGDALKEYAQRMRSRDRKNETLSRRIRDRLTECGAEVLSVDCYESEQTEVLTVRVSRPLRMKRAALRHELEHVCGYRLRFVRREVDPQSALLIFEQDTDLHATMRVFQTRDDVEVSGDATGECRMFGGQVCFALSDGMGSGTSARSESEAAIDLLFRLYHAGMERELIYDNVNRLLLARSDSEMYATLDAVSIDLNSGEAELLKYGAPPSYLLRNGRVKPLCGEALPCGILAEAKPSVIRLKLRANDRIVLCSDGVQDVLPEGAEHAIRSVAHANDAMGELLLKLAESRGGSDDMTVMVIRVA